MAKVIVGKTSDIPEGKMSHPMRGGRRYWLPMYKAVIMQLMIFVMMRSRTYEGELAGKELLAPGMVQNGMLRLEI